MEENLTVPHLISEGMFSIDAVSISLENPFVWSSGINAPIYCDHRLIISNIILRELVVDGLMSIIKSSYSDVESIAGVSTGGVPYAAWLANKLELPLLYVRPTAKAHGKMNFIEGSIGNKNKTLVIEDVLTTGGSAISTSEILRNAGGVVEGVVSIFDYKFKVLNENMAKADLNYSSLYDFFDLMSFARHGEKLSEDVIQKLEKYIESPYQYYTE